MCVDEIRIDPRKRRCDARCEVSSPAGSQRPNPADVNAVVSLVTVTVSTSIGCDYRYLVAAIGEPFGELTHVCFDTARLR
jgi:hypothetical protein